MLLNSCITLTPPQNQTYQKFQSRDNIPAPNLHTSQTLPITQDLNRKTKSSVSEANTTDVEYRNVLMSNHVQAVAADERDVWIGTDRGLSRLNRLTGTWTHYTMSDGLPSDSVNDILIDGDAVWFATERGVSKLTLDAGTWRNFDARDGLVGNNVTCITLDGNYLWFGTDRGLSRYDKGIDNWAAKTKEDGLSSNNITAIAVMEEYIWVGSKAEKRLPGMARWRRRNLGRGGVFRYDKSTDSWNEYSQSDGLVDNEISTIALDEDTVWFGTFTDGISIYSQTDQSFVKSYTQSDLLSSDDITDITVDGNYIWIATANAGVQRHIKSVDTWMKYRTVLSIVDEKPSPSVSEANPLISL